MRLAAASAVPSGTALAVDRERFAACVTAAIENHPLIQLRREEFCDLRANSLALIATGPLTSDALAVRLQALTGAENLAFYDAISPIVDAETLNLERIFRASRYNKGIRARICITLKPACPSKSWRGAATTPCGSAR
jgi:methylenetetrahydrofolate--tRNA-(uracil-5-)-methyltransferase